MHAQQEKKSNEGIKSSGKNNASNASIGYPSRTLVHAKLEMTSPGDQDEVEADSVANDVVSGKLARKVSGSGSSGGVAVSSAMESQLGAMQGHGQQMPEGLKGMMESGLGRDFSQVRLHTDSAAAQMSSSINAKAFTHGNDIYFNAGQYSPHTAEGQHLIAHELTHVAQNNGKISRYTTDLSHLTEEERKIYILKSEIKGLLTFCELRCKDLEEAVKEQEKSDNSFWGRTSRLFNGERTGEYEAQDMLNILKKTLNYSTSLKEQVINSQNLNGLIQAKAQAERYVSMMRLVDSALAMHRLNNIEGADDCISVLKGVETLCFTTVAAVGVALAAPVALGAAGATASATTIAAIDIGVNVGVNAGVGALQATIEQTAGAVSGVSEFSGGEILESAIMGGVSGFIGLKLAGPSSAVVQKVVTPSLAKDVGIGLIASTATNVPTMEGDSSPADTGYSNIHDRVNDFNLKLLMCEEYEIFYSRKYKQFRKGNLFIDTDKRYRQSYTLNTLNEHLEAQPDLENIIPNYLIK